MDIGKLFRDGWGLFTKDLGPLVVGTLIACIIPAVAVTVIAAVTIGASVAGVTTNAQGEVTAVETSSVVLWVVGGAIVVVVGIFLTVPLFAGLLEGVLLRVRQGRPMAYGDAFNGFRLFGRVIGAVLLLAVIFLALLLVPTAIVVAGGVTSTAAVVVAGVLLLIAAIVVYIYLIIRWLYVLPVVVDRGVGVTEAMAESAGLVKGRWWWTLLAYFVLSVVVSAVSTVLGFIPFVGAVATIVLYPFVLTYVVAMYFQARGEGELIDAVTGWVAPGSTGAPAAYSAQAAPYAPPPPAPPAWPMAPAPVPPATGVAGMPSAAVPAAQPDVPPPPAYSPAPPPLPSEAQAADGTAVTQAAPVATPEARPGAAQAPLAPEPPLPPEPPKAP